MVEWKTPLVNIDDKIATIEQWKKEAEIVANSRYEPHEDMSAVARDLAARKRDIAAIKAHTLKMVLDLFKDNG